MTTVAEPIVPPRLTAAADPPRRWLAGALVAQPLLLAVNALFHPEVDIEGASFLEAVADGPGRWHAVHLVATLGALLGVPAAFAIRRLVDGRHLRLRAAAVAAAVAGSTLLALGFAVEASVLPLIERAGIDPPSALALAEDYLETPAFLSILPALGLSALGVAVLAALLLRQRSAARWHALAYVLGIAASAAGPPGSLVGPVAFGVVAVAAVGMARHVRSG